MIDSFATPWTVACQSSVHGILQARILDWFAISFYRGSSQPRYQTQVPWIAGRFFTVWATREAPVYRSLLVNIWSVIQNSELTCQGWRGRRENKKKLFRKKLSRWHSGKESACQRRRGKRLGEIPRWGRSPGGGNDSILQYSCLENPMDRGAWWANVHGVTKSQISLSDWTHTFRKRNQIPA